MERGAWCNTSEETKMSTISVIKTPIRGVELKKYVRDAGTSCSNCGKRLADHKGTYKLNYTGGGFGIACAEVKGREGGFYLGPFSRVFFRKQTNASIVWEPRKEDEFPLPQGCDKAEYDQSGATFYFGHAKIRADGKVLTADKILCDRVYKFRRRDGRFNLPDYPVRLDYIDCLEINEGNLKDVTCRDTDSIHTWEIKLQGVNKPVKIDKNLEMTTYEVSLWLWPDFIHPDWRINLLEGEFDPGFHEGKGTKITINTANRFDGKDSVSLVSGCSNPNDEVRQVCVRGGERLLMHIWIGSDSCGVYEDYREILGTYENHKFVSARTGEMEVLSLDFGTSNTAVGFKKKGDTGEGAVVDFTDHASDRFRLDLNKSDIAMYAGFLPTFGVGKALFLPSELYGDLTQATTFLTTPSKLSLTIPHSNLRADKIAGAGRHDRAENFKWVASEGFDRVSLVRAYLKLAMLLVMAELRSFSTVERLVVTYPAAFDFIRLQEYVDIIRKSIIPFLKENLGVSVNHLYFVNEAVAAAYHHSMSDDKDYLILDLGGGTLDIALFTKKGAERDIRIVDSVRFACRDLITVLGDKKFYPVSRNTPPELNTEDPANNLSSIKLGQRFRNNKVKETLILNKKEDEGRQILLLAFFEGIFHLVRKLIYSYDQTEVPQIVFAGNGWGLVRGIRGVSGLIWQEMMSIIQREHTITGDSRIFENGFPLTVTHNLQYDEANAKHVVSLGALRVKDTLLDRDPLQGTASPVKTILGFDVKIDGVSRSWRDSVPRLGASVDCSDVNNQIHAKWAKLDTGGRNQLDELKSSLGNYIKPRGSSGDRHIERGALAVYLEEFYRSKLIYCSK